MWTTATNWQYVTRTFEGGSKCGYRVKELQLTAGERGCAASHVLAWRRCSEGRKPVLVLEAGRLMQMSILQYIQVEVC
eukprot:Skav225547  [mRNA]  locus=scaffold81:201881:202429:+ [translate_table: standard]